MDIGNAIRYLRKQKGWTQQQLADFAHTSKGNISNLENGHQGYSPAILQYLAKAFKCSVSQIFLLAEQLDEQGQFNPTKNPPIDLLFMQLPDETKHLFIQLIQQFLAQHTTQK